MVELNGVTGLCVTKLDVLDGLDELKICVRYRLDGELLEATPVDCDRWADLEPEYESFPGWRESSRGATALEQLPAHARSYLAAMEERVGAPVHIISTGPDRHENIIRQYPFD
jgi:adenylosuccinate synthase